MLRPQRGCVACAGIAMRPLSSRARMGRAAAVRPDGGLLRLRWLAGAARFERALRRHADALKANFNPGQPRIPAGQSGGGRWTSGSGGRTALFTDQGGEGEAGQTDEGSAPLRITIYPRDFADESEPLPGWSFFDFVLRDLLPSESVRLDPPPKVPARRPNTTRQRNRVAKQVAYWAARSALRISGGPLGVVITLAEAAIWLHEMYPAIQSYQDPPKSLEELQRAVASREKGYDVHHIVEEDAARKAGFPEDWINGPDNLVRIPRLKHWQVTGWYMTPNEDYAGVSPREYLKDKDWATRQQIGYYVLKKYGILTP